MELTTRGIAQVGDVSGPYTATLEGDWVRIRIELIPDASYWSFRIPARDLIHMAEQVKS